MILVTYTLRELLALTDQDLAELQALEDDPVARALWWWTWRDKRAQEGVA